MRTSIATVSISGPLTRKLDAIAAAGFDAVELFENDLITSPATPEEIRARAGDLGLEIALYQPFRDFEAAPSHLVERSLRRAERKFDLMDRLGVSLMLVCSTTDPRSVDDDSLAAEHLHRLAEAADAHGIRIAYEALAWGRHVRDFSHAWRIVRAADHPALGTCLDSFHIMSGASDISAIESIPGERILFLQLADAPRVAMDVVRLSRHHRCFPGQGGLDIAGVLAGALHAGYTGPVSLEVFNDDYRRSEPERAAVDAMRSLLTLQEQTRERLGPTADPAVPTGARERLRIPPPPTRSTGFAFVELAASADGHRQAGRLLGALGFSRTGTHASKPVGLWRLGSACVLVNTDVEGAFDALEVAAIGLETPDPAGGVARAEALLAPVLPRVKGPGEAPLDAVAAPDGTEVFFCRTGRTDHPSWTDDFTAAEPVPTTVAGDARIDHVGLTQPWRHLDEAALFYRSVLALDPSENVESADPYGLVYSRAMRSAGGEVRMALSIEDVGAGTDAPHLRLQHIALHTDDIHATVRRARERGAEFLPIPDNYYDDIEARHGLAPARVAALRELDLLYDHDEHGTFLHCYTAPVGRVFLEVVQRTGGYTGFGAANTPVRRAAQQRHPLTST